jgi:MFS family permease
MKDKPFVYWLCVLAIMNVGLQLFLSGINEYFSTTGLNMTFIMASCFVPVPLTILLYNKAVKKRGLGFGYRYILLVYSVGMALMGLCRFIPKAYLFPFAIGCSLIVSFAIGSFFSVTYTVPSQRAAMRKEEQESASSMYYAIQGLFEGASAGFASGVVLVFLKQNGYVSYLTIIVAVACMTAFVLSFFLPKSITQIGKNES